MDAAIDHFAIMGYRSADVRSVVNKLLKVCPPPPIRNRDECEKGLSFGYNDRRLKDGRFAGDTRVRMLQSRGSAFFRRLILSTDSRVDADSCDYFGLVWL